ncbi:hypothetical protein J6590_022334 [Homalodisca vitripennis]|nr:hypothetical protein J6590_022334 [Homalodisca vitripennis]
MPLIGCLCPSDEGASMNSGVPGTPNVPQQCHEPHGRLISLTLVHHPFTWPYTDINCLPGVTTRPENRGSHKAPFVGHFVESFLALP